MEVIRYSTHMQPQKQKRLPSDLTDGEWERLRPLLPLPKRRGRPRSDDRKTINGILYVLSTGCRWEDMPPERYGSGKTCWYRFKQWRKEKVWTAIGGILLFQLNKRRKIDLTNAYLDTAVVQNKRGVTVRLATRASRGKQA